MQICTLIQDLERRLSAKRELALSASSTALAFGDEAAADRFLNDSDQILSAMGCARLLYSEPSRPHLPLAGVEMMISEALMMIDASARSSALRTHFQIPASDSIQQASYKELLRRANMLRSSQIPIGKMANG